MITNSVEACNITSTPSPTQYSAQGQVFHYKRRHQGCSSAQRQVFHRKLSDQGCSFIRDEQVRYLPVAFRTPLSTQHEQTLKELKRSHGHQHGGEESGFDYTSIHRMIIVQEQRHPHIFAKSYSSPSLSFPKPAHFSLHCTVQSICLPFKPSSVHRDVIKKKQFQDLQPLRHCQMAF